MLVLSLGAEKLREEGDKDTGKTTSQHEKYTLRLLKCMRRIRL